MSRRRKYDRQFKIDAVKLLNESGRTATEIANNLGIKSDLLSRWKKELSEENKKAFPGQGNTRDEEMLRLKKEIADIRMERDILKKAVAIFSRPERKNTNS
jgi:transposase-like protein